MWCNSNNFVIGITVSVWTVVQTSFHIIWALWGYYFYVCKIKPSHYWLVILYLTYFYKHDCGDITLESDDIFAIKEEKKNIINLTSNATEQESLFDIIETILEKAILPKESSAAWRTHVYIYAFIISDAAWIISAFLLFAGTCFQIKKCVSLLFYCPWLIVTACVILLDVISSVHFGLDILHIHSFTTWLKFIGVQNYEDFSTFNTHKASNLIPLIPVILLCLLFSRIFIFWILNIVQFYQIFHVAIMAFQNNLDGKREGDPKRGRQKSQTLDLNSSESRIRNWQLFYGATESTGTSSSSTSKSSTKDCNSNRSTRPSKNSIKETMADTNTLTKPSQSLASLDSYGRYILSIREESLKSRPDLSIYYRGYSDVAEGIENSTDKSDATEYPLPWSYFKPPEEEYREGYNSSNVSTNNYSHFRMHHGTLNNNVTSTEL